MKKKKIYEIEMSLWGLYVIYRNVRKYKRHSMIRRRNNYILFFYYI